MKVRSLLAAIGVSLLLFSLSSKTLAVGEVGDERDGYTIVDPSSGTMCLDASQQVGLSEKNAESLCETVSNSCFGVYFNSMGFSLQSAAKVCENIDQSCFDHRVFEVGEDAERAVERCLLK